MNNEEKILALLEQLQAGQAELQAGQAELQAGQAELQAGQAELQAGQAELQASQAQTNNRLDTMQGDIQELKDGQAAIKEQISNIDESIGAIADWADATSIVTKVPFAGSGMPTK